MALGQPDERYQRGGKIFERYGQLYDFGIIVFEERSDFSVRLSYWAEPFWPEVEQDLVKNQTSLSLDNIDDNSVN